MMVFFMISTLSGINSTSQAFQSAKRCHDKPAQKASIPAFTAQQDLPRNFTAAELAGMMQTIKAGQPAATTATAATNATTTTTVQPKKEFKLCRAEHILIDTKKRDAQKANQIATQLLNDIHTGKISFEDAARELSDCPSGKEGGDLGYFDKSSMVAPFSEAAFNTEVNQIVGPVETEFGYHLIKVLDKK